MQCPVTADSNPLSSSINDTVTVNAMHESNAIAAAIQQTRTQSSASGGRSTSAAANSVPPQAIIIIAIYNGYT